MMHHQVTQTPSVSQRSIVAVGLLLATGPGVAAVEIDTGLANASDGTREGVFEADVDPEPAEYRAVARTDAGGYILAGDGVVGGGDRHFVVTGLTADGALDTDFGTDGHRIIAPSKNPSLQAKATDVAIDSQGRPVVVGHTGTDSSGLDFVILRLGREGQRANDELVRRDVDINGASGDQNANAVALDSNDNVYIAGWTEEIDAPDTRQAVMARYDGNNLSKNWVKKTDSQQQNEPAQYNALALMDDAVVATGWDGFRDKPNVTYLVNQQALDASQGAKPKRGTGPRDNARAHGACVQNGEIIITGITGDDPRQFDSQGDGADPLVVRLADDLSAATEVTLAPDGTGGTARGCAADNADGILLTGVVADGKLEELFVGRLDANDGADDTFASGGLQRFVYRQESSANKHIARSITSVAESTFVVAGAYNSDGSQNFSRDTATAMAFTADVLTDDGDDGGGDGNDGGGDGGDGNSGSGGSGSLASSLLLMLLMASLMTAQRRGPDSCAGKTRHPARAVASNN
jgi:hypothetical protein